VTRRPSDWVEAPEPSRDERDRLKAEGKGRSRKINGDWVWQVKGQGEAISYGLYRFVVRCSLTRFDGVVVGTGLGVCSTMESKYISRPSECENTALKMAMKRALVAAVLGTFGLSEAFTQDVGDDEDDEDVRSVRAPAVVAKYEEPAEVVDDAEVRRIKEARAGIAAHAKRIGLKQTEIAPLVRAENGGALPENSIQWEGVLAAFKEMNVIDASAEEFAARKDKPTTEAA
jgi:hypothetical protein